MRRVDPHQTEAARRVDPTPLLMRLGFNVHRPNNGRHIYVRDSKVELFRITQVSEGHYVACDKSGGAIGDNIALLRHLEPCTTFPSAVAQLLGIPDAEGVEARNEFRVADEKRPKLPRTSAAAQTAGRRYLRDRAIQSEVILDAEGQGFLAYVDDGVLTIGRSADGEIRWISKRFLPGLTGPKGEIKRDFAGSEKRFAAILRGQSTRVVVVEGGIDALAAHCIARRRCHLTPTVIVTGGSRCLAWINEEHIGVLLRDAEAIVVVFENELDDGGETDRCIQAQTDRDHERQISRIVAQTGKTVVRWRPSCGVKDLAELNARESGGVAHGQ